MLSAHITHMLMMKIANKNGSMRRAPFQTMRVAQRRLQVDMPVYLKLSTKPSNMHAFDIALPAHTQNGETNGSSNK